MAIGFQAEVLAKEGKLRPDLVDELIMASLNFAAVTVEIHSQLSPKGRQVLEGRLRDALKAENGLEVKKDKLIEAYIDELSRKLPEGENLQVLVVAGA
jgi:hypothetical protein